MAEDVLKAAAETTGNLSFAWDRKESAEALRSKLATATPDRWIEMAASIMIEPLDLSEFRSFVDRIRKKLAIRALPPES